MCIIVVYNENGGKWWVIDIVNLVIVIVSDMGYFICFVCFLVFFVIVNESEDFLGNFKICCNWR